MSEWDKHVFEHGNIQQIAPSLWSVTGKLPYGIMPRNMMLVKLSDSSLMIHSGIALNEPMMQDIERLGTPSILIVPNRLHRLDAQVYKNRYPNIKVLCPRAAVQHVSKKVKVDATCEEVLPHYGIVYHEPGGIRPGELCYEINAGDGQALVVTDLLFNLSHQPGFGGFVLKLVGSTGYFGMSNIGKLFMLKDKVLFKQWLLNMSHNRDIKYVCMAHGDIIKGEATEKLREAAERL